MKARRARFGGRTGTRLRWSCWNAGAAACAWGGGPGVGECGVVRVVAGDAEVDTEGVVQALGVGVGQEDTEGVVVVEDEAEVTHRLLSVRISTHFPIARVILLLTCMMTILLT